MKVSEVMSRHVRTVRADESLRKATQVMLWGGLRHLPVLDAKGSGYVLGVVSQCDVLQYRVHSGLEEPLDAPVSKAMSVPAAVAYEDDPVEDAARRMSELKIGCLPVLHDEEVVGIITATDLLALEARREIDTRSFGGVTARDLMTPDPLTIRADDKLLDAVGRMSHAGVRHLPVVDGDGRVVSMLSDRDVRTAVGDLAGERRPSRTAEAMRVRHVVSATAYTVGENEPFEDMLKLFCDARFGALLVVDDDQRPVGIVSYIDVLLRLASEGRSGSLASLGANA